MKYILKCISVIILLSTIISSIPITSSAASSYTDITNHWAKTHIEYVTGKGVMNDYTGQFKPNEYVKRGDAVKYLYDFMHALAGTTDTHPFGNEIPTSYEKAFKWAYSKQVIHGTTTGSFAFDTNIKRQDMFFMIYNAYQTYKVYFEKSIYTKYNEYYSTDEYARDAVLALYQQGIIQGNDSGNVTPTAKLTRAQLAVTFYQLYQIIYFCPIDALHQSSSNWCWAYAGNMVGSYHYVSPPITTSTIVYSIKGGEVGTNVGGSLDDTKNAARLASNYTKSYTRSNSIVSDTDIKTKILSHKPFIAIHELNSMAKHAIAICGYSYNNGTFSIIISDPKNDRLTRVTYSNFVYGYNSMNWTHTIYQP